MKVLFYIGFALNRKDIMCYRVEEIQALLHKDMTIQLKREDIQLEINNIIWNKAIPKKDIPEHLECNLEGSYDYLETLGPHYDIAYETASLIERGWVISDDVHGIGWEAYLDALALQKEKVPAGNETLKKT